MMLKRRDAILMSLLMAGAPFASRASGEQHSALYKAARLRYLSQRIAKAYMQGALNVLPDRAEQIIDTSIKQSRDLLADLKRAPAANPQLAKTFADTQAKAEAFYTEADLKPGAAKAAAILKLSDEVFALGDQLAAIHQAQEKSPAGMLQNLVGRQRGLSQRMARDFFMARLTNTAAPASMPIARQEFNASLETLANASVSTPAIQTNLGLLRNQWIFLDQALSHADSAPAVLANVATTSERILEILDDLVDLYESAMRSQR